MPFYQGIAPGMPGLGNTTYARGRMIWAGLAGIQYLPVGGIIASALSRDPDNWEGSTNYGNETEPETPPTTAALSNIPQLPGAVNGAAPTGTLPGYAGVLRAGLLMGRIGGQGTTPTVATSLSITAYKGMYRPSILGVTTATQATGQTSASVSASCYYEVARQYALGVTTFTMIGCQSGTLGTLVTGTMVLTTAPTLSGTTGTLTFSTMTNSPAQTMAIGAFVCPADDSQYPVTFVDEQFGLNMVDALGNTVDAGNSSSNSLAIAPFPRVPLAGGIVNVLNIVNYPTSTLLAQIRWLKACLNSGGSTTTTATNYGGKFNFTDDYGL